MFTQNKALRASSGLEDFGIVLNVFNHPPTPVFKLLHAFKPLSSFSPLGQNCRSLFRRDFGSALTSFAVLELFHKNKPLTTLRCRSLLFLLLRDSVRCAHRLEIAFGSLRRLRFRGLTAGHPASLRTPFAFSGFASLTLRNFAPPYVKSLPRERRSGESVRCNTETIDVRKT